MCFSARSIFSLDPLKFIMRANKQTYNFFPEIIGPLPEITIIWECPLVVDREETEQLRPSLESIETRDTFRNELLLDKRRQSQSGSGLGPDPSILKPALPDSFQSCTEHKRKDT